jgi:hypothetical protein
MVGKAQKSHGARSRMYGGCSNGVPPIFVSELIHCHFSRMCSAIVLKEESFFSGKIRHLLPYRVSEIPPKDSGITLPTDSLPWRHSMLQNCPFGVEEENEHVFTRGSFHLPRSFLRL